MSQERWDVVFRFLNGPRQFEADLVMRGPVVRLGSNPGPNGLKLDGYRALDDRHAVVSAYQGGTAQIAPVGPNQVRVAPHENLDWATVQPIRGPVYLSEGCAVHLGPPGRGATFTFVECRRLGVWQQGALASEASDAGGSQEAGPSQVRQLDVGRRIPVWFVPGLALMVFTTLGMVALLVLVVIQNKVEPLGPVDPGKEYYDYGDVFDVTLDTKLVAATGDGFADFVSGINAAQSGHPEDKDAMVADRTLVEMVTRSEQMYAHGWKFWDKLEQAHERYAMVLGKLRKAGLPDVLAGVPYQESGYRVDAKDSILCAYGMWQFQPEIAFRNGLTVTGCHNSKSGMDNWHPTEKALPIGALKNAEYVDNNRCMISSCDQDDRDDPQRATDAAVRNFGDPWKDQALKDSGALVQITIASHNAGYNDSKYRSNGKVSHTNVGVSYPEYLTANKLVRAPNFIGANMTCTKAGDMIKANIESINDRCGGVLPAVTQTYVPYVIAQHLIAVCYYGRNYPAISEFKQYEPYSRGYCAGFKVPSSAEVIAHRGMK